MSVDTIAGPAHEGGILGAPPSSDTAGSRPRTAGLVAAVLLHAAVIALFLAKLPAEEREKEPPAIPVELVLAAQPKPAPQAPPKPPPQTQLHRESGGDAEKAPGRAAEAEAQPSKEAVPPPPAPANLPAPVETPKPPAPPEIAALPKDAEAPEPPVPVLPPAQPEKPKPVMAAVPPARHPPAQSPAVQSPPTRIPSESSLPGEGGGDRYLNKVRDSILGNLIYPGSARSHGIAGVARYELVVDRQGRLLQARIVRSSGADDLDRAGLEAVELSAPFGPPPPDVIGDQIGLLLTLYIGPETRGTR
ncbi:MAG: energy transducer TonB [Alphaproteobacteria bacterium]